MDGRDPSRLRISDDDRHRVAEVLRTAAGEGRLDLDELDERLGAAYAAKTYADLVPLTADLPLHGTTAALPVPHARSGLPALPGPSYTGSLAIMSETKRAGAWTVESTHTAFALMGGVVVDLREAHFETSGVVIYASAVMGEVKVIVNATTSVVVEGLPIMGDFTEQRPKVDHEPTPGAPVVRVKGFSLMGSVNVQRRPMPGEERNILGRPRRH